MKENGLDAFIHPQPRMPDQFQYDVFLSHSTKDKTIVRELAERLRMDGLKVWFDEWVLKAGDSIPRKIEEGLEHSRVLVLLMSANAFGSDWAQLETGTFRFRDPLNKERRFIPVRLDDAAIQGSLKQFLHLDWRQKSEAVYQSLLEACERREREPLSFIQVRLIAINTSARRVGTNTRFEIKLEALNESDWTLGSSGLTINVPTIKSVEVFKSLAVHNQSNSPSSTIVRAPHDTIFGFLQDCDPSNIGGASRFGEMPAKNLFIENAFEAWEPQRSIWLRCIIDAPVHSVGSKLDLHVRIWANLPNVDPQVIGDPGWQYSRVKDQQGIPAYPQSIGF